MVNITRHINIFITIIQIFSPFHECKKPLVFFNTSTGLVQVVVIKVSFTALVLLHQIYHSYSCSIFLG